jgi:hypothetical protein
MEGIEMRKWMVILTAMLLALPIAAFAQSASTAEKSTRSVTAEGDGTARLRGNGWVQISGSGVLIIQDREGDAAISITGAGMMTTRGSSITYRGFDGEAYITGSAITVILRGADIVLEASGKGSVKLRGTGTYTFNGQSGEWSTTGVNLAIEE